MYSQLSTLIEGDTVGERLMSFLMLAYAFASTKVAGRDPLGDFDLSNGPVHAAKQAGLVVGILVLGIVAIVGILVFDTVNSSIDLDTGDPNTTHNLSGPLGDLETFFGDSMSLVGVAMIVGVAALIISLVAGMGGGGDGNGLR